MHGRLTHVAINADDLPGTQRFYEGVFGWSFEEYMPGFTRTAGAGVDFCALQQRRNLLQRIDRFVTALERSQRPPTAHEAQGVLDALASLELRLYPLGEEAMMRVEKAGRRRGGRVWPGRPNRSS